MKRCFDFYSGVNETLKRLYMPLALACLWTITASTSFALDANTIEAVEITASVTIGGPAPGPDLESEPIVIRHTPIRGISPITKMAIIQGEAGTNPYQMNSSFPNRISAIVGQSIVRSLADTDRIRITLFYRIGEQALLPTLPFIASQPLEGPDPTAFAFQIDPSSITENSVLEYKIKAEKMVLDPDSNTIVVSTITWFPVQAQSENDPFAVQINIVEPASQLIGPEGGRLLILEGNPNVGETTLDVPAGLFQSPSEVLLNQKPLNDPSIPAPAGFSSPVAAYEFDTTMPVSGGLLLSVLYPDFTFPSGQDNVLDGTNAPEGSATLFWWDGFNWRPIRGKIDANSNLLKAQISKPGIYVIAPAAALAPSDFRTYERIITPNGDNHNDTADFGFGSPDVKVEIFDISGHRVRTLNGTTSWDGRDDSNSIVESGVYIYQYQHEGERVSGLIAVAK